MAWPTIQAPTAIQAKYIKAQHRSKFETGRPLSRAKHTKGRRQWTLNWTSMTQADLDLLLAAFESDVGGTFSWTHPLTSTVYTVGYGEDAVDYNLDGRRVDRYEVKVVIEER